MPPPPVPPPPPSDEPPELPPELPPEPEVGGQLTDNETGRIFPCDQCGADLTFQPSQSELVCPYCGYHKTIEVSPQAAVGENDYETMLIKLEEWRREGVEDAQHTSEVRCESCGGQVQFVGALTSTECPYCASPIQRENIHNSPQRVPVDGVLPFRVEQPKAAELLRNWVSSRWFAPTEFVKKGVTAQFQGVYEPYFTFDAATFTRYSGERGEHYYVTVGSGKDERKERRTRWWPASGSFKRFFNDVLVHASVGLPVGLVRALEPWPLEECQPFRPEYLAGFLARTYEINLEDSAANAKQLMEGELRGDSLRRIGGDEQRLHSMFVDYSQVTFKHLLLPLWLLSYRFHDKLYRVMINARTGEVQGERPYSFWKIFFAVLFGVALAGGIWLLVKMQQG